MEWLKELKVADLPDQYHEMVELIGLENTIRLALHYNKQGFYFSRMDDVVRVKKEEYIRRNFNGANHKELARATGYSERWVYEILAIRGNDNQVDMFREGE